MKSEKGYTYFIQPVQGGPVKIGLSTDPDVRLRSIHIASPVPLQIVGLIDDNCEASLHEKFAELRLHGEWFSPAESLMEYIRSHAQGDLAALRSQQSQRRQEEENKKSDALKLEQNYFLKNPTEEPLIPLSEVAKKYAVSVATVISWHKIGKGTNANGEPICLEAIKPGRQYLTTWKSVLDFVERRGQGYTKSELQENRSKRSAYYEAKLKARLGIS